MATSRTKGMASYRRVSRNTALPGQRIVMLYDGILKALQTAKSAIEDDSPQRFEVVHNELQRSQQIIRALISALDYNADNDLAQTLSDLYEYWISRLSQANLRNDKEIIEEVEGLVSEMRKTWQQVAAESMKK